MISFSRIKIGVDQRLCSTQILLGFCLIDKNKSVKLIMAMLAIIMATKLKIFSNKNFNSKSYKNKSYSSKYLHPNIVKKKSKKLSMLISKTYRIHNLISSYIKSLLNKENSHNKD